MANIKSAKKRILVTQTKTAKNKAVRSEVKTRLLQKLHSRMLLPLSRPHVLREFTTRTMQLAKFPV